MTPEERREAQIRAASPDHILGEEARHRVEAYLSLMIYFGRNEPAVADAIRYGLDRAASVDPNESELHWYDTDCDDDPNSSPVCEPLYRIAKEDK